MVMSQHRTGCRESGYITVTFNCTGTISTVPTEIKMKYKLSLLLLVSCVGWINIGSFMHRKNDIVYISACNGHYHNVAMQHTLRWRSTTVSMSSSNIESNSKGFGVSKKEQSNISIKPTGATKFKHKSGEFAQLLIRESKKFDNIIKLDFNDRVIHDCYARLEGSEVCWFIGKVAHIPEVSMKDAFELYIILLKEYSKSLRPKELAVKSTGVNLQIWYAPGNSEMSVAQNKISLKLYAPVAIGSGNTESQPSDVSKVGAVESFIGFQPEVYQDGEEGFRVLRDSNGQPLGKPFEVTMNSPTSLQS